MNFIYQSIPDMIPIALVQPDVIDRCIARNNSNYLDLESSGFRTDWQRPGRHGCVKKEGYEEGIPLYKMLAWVWWEPAWHPMGKTFTVAPENWGFFKGNKGNTYLGEFNPRQQGALS
jgi:DNA mismatch repair protein MSH3